MQSRHRLHKVSQLCDELAIAQCVPYFDLCSASTYQHCTFNSSFIRLPLLLQTLTLQSSCHINIVNEATTKQSFIENNELQIIWSSYKKTYLQPDDERIKFQADSRYAIRPTW